MENLSAAPKPKNQTHCSIKSFRDHKKLGWVKTNERSQAGMELSQSLSQQKTRITEDRTGTTRTTSITTD